MNLKKLKLLLINAGVTIKELSELLHISRQTFYTKTEKGTFTEKEKKTIAEKIHCKVSDL